MEITVQANLELQVEQQRSLAETETPHLHRPTEREDSPVEAWSNNMQLLKEDVSTMFGRVSGPTAMRGPLLQER
jgi:hypothetical protein